MYGMGNWKAIGRHIGRPANQCSRHYDRVYLRSSTFPLPQKEKQAENDSTSLQTDPRDTAKNNGTGKTKTKNVKKRKSKVAEIAGYMPKRGDFDIEYDNDAELLLADLEFEDHDTPEDRKLKLKMLDIYEQKLKVREQMRKIVLEHGLLDFKNHQNRERKYSKAERQIHNAHRCFARFWSAEEHEEYMKGLNKELHLRQRIAELQHYRENGIRSLEEAEAYDQIRKQKELNLILTKRSGLKTIAPAQQTSSVLSQMEKRLCTTLNLKHDDFNRIKSHILSSLPSTKSVSSNVGFTFFNRKHHCRLCGQIFCDDCAPTSSTLGVRICRECGSLIRKRFGGDDSAIASLVKDNGPSFSSVLETAASGAGVGLLVGVAVDSIGAVARKGGRGVHKVARVTGKTLDAGLQGAKKLDKKYGITNKTASAAVGAVSAIKKGVEFVSEKITGKEVKSSHEEEDDEKDFVQNTMSSKAPDEQTLLSPFERGVEPEFAYEDTAIDNITGS
eukprot:g6939.t1